MTKIEKKTHNSRQNTTQKISDWSTIFFTFYQLHQLGILERKILVRIYKYSVFPQHMNYVCRSRHEINYVHMNVKKTEFYVGCNQCIIVSHHFVYLECIHLCENCKRIVLDLMVFFYGVPYICCISCVTTKIIQYKIVQIKTDW